MKNSLAFFRCLFCRHTEVEASNRSLLCTTCGATYPILQDIPILVRDWQKHSMDLEQARQVKPDWYLQEQPAEVASPWRHHIKKRRLYVQTTIQDHLRQQGRQRASVLLDLGCGDGNHLDYLKNYTDTLYGSDYNLVRLVRAHHRCPETRLFLADILDYPALDNFFDVIFFHHVLEHIVDDMAALSTAGRLLSKGGLLILGTPNEGAWWWQLAYRLQPEMLRSSDHVHFYTAPEVMQKVQACGLTVRNVRHMGWGPPHWGLDGRIRRYQWVDDAWEWFGKRMLPSQASSLYVIATKQD